MTKGNFLIKSMGITNDTTKKALEDLLEKSISESTAFYVPQ